MTAPVPHDQWSLPHGWDRLLEHRSRLGICVMLARGSRITFRRLRDLLDETNGGLGAHLKRLDDAGYVTATKRFVDRKPVTWYALTSRGRRALQDHLGAMDNIVHDSGQADRRG